jgi:hypothetical protein
LIDDFPLLILGSVVLIIFALTLTGFTKGRIRGGINSSFQNWTFDVQSAAIKEWKYFQESFAFRFLPVFLFTIFGHIWVQADEFYRATEPYAGMDKAAPASSNILLDYPSSHPVSVTAKALAKGHYRVALFSALSLAATAPPIIAIGVFTSTPSATGLTILIQPVGFYVSFVILIIYAFCLCMVRPPPRYRLPRSISSINDTFSYCYASRILDEVGVDGKPIFSAQGAGETRSHLKARIYLAKKQYQFGLYLGKDGRRHMGFDIPSRNDRTGHPVVVTEFDPGFGFRNSWGRFGLRSYFLKTPTVIQRQTV